MKNLLILFFSFLNLCNVKAQSNQFVELLTKDKSNEIFVFKDMCSGCLVMNPPCKEYTNSGNPEDTYVLWKNNKGFYIKSFNICGSSKTISFKEWKNDPFLFIKSKSIALDTIKIQYPLSYNKEKDIWLETRINHYKYYLLSFPSYKISDIEISDIAFIDESKYDSFEEMKSDEPNEFYELYNKENKRNLLRYKFNNNSEIKKLLDIVKLKIREIRKKLKTQ